MFVPSSVSENDGEPLNQFPEYVSIVAPLVSIVVNFDCKLQFMNPEIPA